MRVDLEVSQAAVVRTELGPMLAGATTRGLRWIEFDDDIDRLQASLRQRFPNAAYGEEPPLSDWIASLCQSIGTPMSPGDVPLDIRGTPFQRSVWMALQQIPVGTTESYAQLAKRIGKPTATRAVASACASNDLAVVIPCHRVIRSDGGLGGYRWGLERKESLLDRERSVA